MIQDIELYTADGRLVETVQDPIVGLMAANGKPPEVLVWGERVFMLASPDAYQPGTIRYREGMAWALLLGQEATAMPSPSVDGSLAGETMLPVGTSAAIPRAETTDSDIPGAEKMTESYKPPEDETAGQHLARLGTDGWTWMQDFAYRFPGSIAGMNMGRRADAGTMLGWFANAIEAGRTAGCAQGCAAVTDETPWAVNQILEGAPESWDDDASPDHVAVQYVKELERRLDAAGISRGKYVEDLFGNVSDGYHTFRELYDHRRALTVALARSIPGLSWRSKQHHPDSDAMFDGYFIVGLSLPSGQVTYHYKLEHWDDFNGVRVLDHAPPYDGHTPAMTIERLMSWTPDPAPARYVELAKILADFDRCVHGRHRADSCFDCLAGRSTGNPHLPSPGWAVGYDYGGRPYVVPAEGRSFSDPEAWRP